MEAPEKQMEQQLGSSELLPEQLRHLQLAAHLSDSQVKVNQGKDWNRRPATMAL